MKSKLLHIPLNLTFRHLCPYNKANLFKLGGGLCLLFFHSIGIYQAFCLFYIVHTQSTNKQEQTFSQNNLKVQCYRFMWMTNMTLFIGIL